MPRSNAARSPVDKNTMESDPAVRRSGRVRTVPELFMKQKFMASAKNRRASVSDESEVDELDSDASSEHNADSDEEQQEDEATKERSNGRGRSATKISGRRARRSQKTHVVIAASQLVEQASDEVNDDEQIEDVDVNVEEMAKSWIVDYTNDKLSGVRQLVDFLIRSAGCMMSVRAEAFSSDEVAVNVLQELQEELAKLPHHEYPIISKSRRHKQLKNNLIGFFQSLIDQCQHEIIYDGVFIETLQSWLTTMSSSIYRPFRHTASVIALKIMGSLCVIAEKVHDEVVIGSRQLATERRKTGRSRNNEKERLLQQRTEALSRKQKDLQEFIGDFFEGVFVHRSRDVEAFIRSECIKELCNWVQQYPTHFADNQFLRYFGWAFNDQNPLVRSESVKAVTRLYKIEDILEKLKNFTQRFRGRIEEMALYDVDISVRVNATTLCTTLFNHSHDFISDEGQKSLTNLILADSLRVRKSVAPLVHAMFENQLLQPALVQARESLANSASMHVDGEGSRPRRAAKASVNVNKQWVIFKSIASFLVTRTASESLDSLDYDQETRSLSIKNMTLTVTSAVESLWDHIHDLHDYQSMSDYLCRDHSRVQGSQSTSATEIEDCYRLNEDEETIMIVVFLACVQTAVKRGFEKGSAKEKKKDDGQLEEVRNVISRHLAQSIPRLLSKYSDDMNRLTHLVQLPQVMNINVYLELRMTEAYEELFQKLSKIFLGSTLPDLLLQSSLSLKHLTGAKYMIDLNDGLLSELQDQVVSHVRDACRGKDLYTTQFSADTIRAISVSVQRLDHLLSFLDATEAMDESEDMALDVTELMGGLVERASLGYSKEDQMSQSAMGVLFRYIAWKCERISNDPELSAQGVAATSTLEKRRDWIMDKLNEIVVGNDTRPLVSIRRMAFGILVDLYWLFSSDLFVNRRLEHLRLLCSEQTQSSYVQYIEQEINEHVQQHRRVQTESEDSEQDPLEDGSFEKLMISFAKALFLHVVDLSHAPLFLSRYGFSDDIDEPIHALVDELKNDLVSHEAATERTCRVYLDSLTKCFELDTTSPTRSSMDRLLKLTRLQNQSIQNADKEDLARHVPPRVICERIHVDGITYILADRNQVKDRMRFFRVLSVFAKTLTRARDIGHIHKHLESCLETLGMEPDKDWDAYHAYVKVIDGVLKKKGLRYDPTRRVEEVETPAPGIEFALPDMDMEAEDDHVGDLAVKESGKRPLDHAMDVDEVSEPETPKRRR